MKKLIPLILVLMLVLSACGNGDRKSVESFSGETVATISNTRQSEQPATQVPTDGSTPVSTATATLKATRSQTATPVGAEPTQSHTATRTATRLVSPVVSESPYPIASQETATQTNPAPSKTPTKTNPPKATNTATTTLAATTPSPSKTAAPTATATFSPDSWEGEWQVSFETAEGVFKTGTLVFSRDPGDASRMQASGSIDGVEYQFYGTLLYDDIHINGSWKTASSSGEFWIFREKFTFRGSNNSARAFCGARREMALPSPCFGSVPK